MIGSSESVPPEVGPTSEDAFLGGRLKVLQPSRGFRSGIDAVLLASAVPVDGKKQERVLDAGAGVGVVGLAVAVRQPAVNVLLVEIDPAHAGLARANIARNGLEARVGVAMADLGRGGGAFHDPERASGLDAGTFDHVAANPPYHLSGGGTSPANARRALAHQMGGEELDRWFAFGATALRHGGTLTLIHLAEALDKVLAGLAGRFGAVRVRPVHARAHAPAIRVLVSAAKGSRAPMTLLPPLVLQDDAGRYLADVEAVLRHGSAISMSP